MLYDLTVIIPVYNSAEALPVLTQRTQTVLCGLGIAFHVLFVDDASEAPTQDILKKLSEKYSFVDVIRLRKNAGQQHAIFCGIEHAKNSRYLLLMDDDLQHPPETIPQLYETIQDPYDLVYAIPNHAHNKTHRRIGSKLRDRLFSRFICKSDMLKVSSFCIFTQDLAAKVRSVTRPFHYFSASAFCFPIRAANIGYDRHPRLYGSSGYSLIKLIKLYGKILFYYSSIGEKIFAKERTTRAFYEIAEILKVCNRTKRIMILGGSNCQKNAFFKANQLGFETVLIDYNENPPAAEYANFHEQYSTFDLAACVAAAKMYHADAVVTIGTDQPVYTAAVVAEQRNLPSAINTQTAFSATNKKAMKERFSQCGIPTVPYRLISRDDLPLSIKDDALNAPYVLKPLDAQGQRGVFKVSDVNEIAEYLPQTFAYSRENTALLEEYYPSDEITVSCWVENGTVSVLAVTDRLRVEDELHIGICSAHHFPSKHINRFTEIQMLCARITDAFAIKTGPLYIQMLAGCDGIKINEIACRIGGAFEDVFIPYLSGFDILKAVILTGLGLNCDTKNLAEFNVTRSEKQISVELIFCKSGLIADITPREKIRTLPFVLDVGYNYKKGDHIPKTENATARFGHCVIASDDGHIAEYIDRFYTIFYVTSADGENLVIRQNDIDSFLLKRSLP